MIQMLYLPLFLAHMQQGDIRRGAILIWGFFFAEHPKGLDLLNLIHRLSELAGRDVDVVVLNKASAFVRHQAMKNKIVLIVKDKTVYRRFREKTISDYDEYKYISGLSAYA